MIEVSAEKAKKRNEWYTPKKYIEAAREVMGSIDLDPASCAFANETVRATKYFDEAMNGLEQRWHGNIWLNPPFSSSLSPAGMSGGKRRGPTDLWIHKLIDVFDCGDVSQAIVCVNANTVRLWFQCLWEYSICFVSHPVQFIRPDQSLEHHFFGTAFAYLGPRADYFDDLFSDFGHVVLPRTF